MAQRRSEATINNELDLRVWFRNDSDGTAFDPVEITQVEILDEDCVTVLETIASGDVVNLAPGHYQIITSDTWNTTAKVVYDKWYFRRVAAGVIYTSIQSTFVFADSVPTAKYSSVTQLRYNVPRITIAVMSDNAVIDKISQADSIVEQDCSNVIDFTDMPVITDVPPTPDYINLLSQYKTAEMCLVSKFGAKRTVKEQSDREYWADMYAALLDKILSGVIDVGDFGLGGTTYQNYARADIVPALGQGEEGEFLDNEDLNSLREDFGGVLDDD